jgi:anti-sigma B factor antagonist
MILEAELDRTDPTTAIFRLTGRMTLGMRLRETESKIGDTIDSGIKRLILELSAVEFVDSAGLGLLMLLYGRMKAGGGTLHIVAPSHRLLEMLKMTCTDSILTINPTIDAALAS